MRDKEKISIYGFILITVLTIISKNLPDDSLLKHISVILSIIILMPYEYIIIRYKMYNKKLTLVCGMLALLQIAAIIL